MFDLSDMPHVKKLCHKLSNDRYHNINLYQINQNIELMKEKNGSVDWEIVKGICRDLVRRTINAHCINRNTFGLFEKIQMAENLVEYFKNKHGEK